MLVADSRKEQLQHKQFYMEPKLYLNMILADTEPVELVRKSIESVIDFVDGAYIGLNYKDKPTKPSNPLLRTLNKLGCKVIPFKWEGDFAKARQLVLDATPFGASNYIYWQDADDTLTNPHMLRPILNDMVKTNQSAAFFTYYYTVEFDAKENIKEVIIEHKRERIARNDGTYKWVGKLHETLINQKQENVSQYVRPECVVVHHTSGDRFDKNLNRNIEILENQLREEQNKDPRTKIYLAKAYFDRARTKKAGEQKIDYQLAMALLYEYLNGAGTPGTTEWREPSGWPEERSQAWKYVGEIAFAQGNVKMAIKAYQSAIEEYPYYPDYYVDMAMAYVAINDYSAAKHWLKIATTIDIPKTTHIVTPRDLKSRALEASFHINFNEGKFQEARQNVMMLKELYPDNTDLDTRIAMLESVEAANHASQSVVFLGKYLESSNDPKRAEKLAALVKAIPTDLLQEKFAAEMRHKFLPARIWEKNEITLLCGPGAEQWNPDSVKTGIGGSEEAVIYLAQEFTKRGWKVTVYGNPGDKAGDFDGVTYLPWYDVNIKDEFNVLILWRFVGFIDFDPKAKFKMLWLHDVPNNPDFTKERVDKIDKIAVLSEYHKSLLRVFNNGRPERMPENKVFVTTNGIPPIPTAIVDDDKKVEEGKIMVPIKRESKKLIYSSSPDRGLIYLLSMWGDIRKEVPDAELHIFYGFKVYDALSRGNPSREAWKNQLVEMMKQPGITYHGRVGHDDLHRFMATTSIWAYPTDFTEISCITAMKAQRLGAIPVCTTLGALNETVKNGIKVDVDITEPDGQKEYYNALVALLKDTDKQVGLRNGMVKWAERYFDWSNVAEDWIQLFNVYTQNTFAKGDDEYAIPRDSE